MHTAHPIRLPAGQYAERRHLRYDEALACWTVLCMSCGEDLPADSDFYIADTTMHSVPHRFCNACRAEKYRAWYRKKGRASRAAKHAHSGLGRSSSRLITARDAGSIPAPAGRAYVQASFYSTEGERDPNRAATVEITLPFGRAQALAGRRVALVTIDDGLGETTARDAAVEARK